MWFKKLKNTIWKVGSRIKCGMTAERALKQVQGDSKSKETPDARRLLVRGDSLLRVAMTGKVLKRVQGDNVLSSQPMSSSPRMRGSNKYTVGRIMNWIPAFAGMTVKRAGMTAEKVLKRVQHDRGGVQGDNRLPRSLRSLAMTKVRSLAILVGFLIIMVPVLILVPRFFTKAQASWYDDNFAYRQTVAVTNAGSAQTNYQIPISLDTATLITAGKMQSSCNDIRVTDFNGKLLSLWLETGTNACNTVTTKIWVKVPSVPTPQNVLLLYYGNPLAPSVSDGSKVFEFFDDFANGTSPDSAKWSTTGSPTISSGTAVLTNGAKMVSTATTTDSSGLGRLIARVKQGATTLTGGKVGFSNTNTLATNFHNDDAVTVNLGSTEEQVAQTASTNLISHYLLEETTSTDANQFKASGYLDTGKLSQAVSIYGNAAGTSFSTLTFNRGAQISGNNYERINMNQGTISFWFKPSWNGNDGLTHVIFTSNTVGAGSSASIYKNTGNNLVFRLEPTEGKKAVEISVSSSITSGNWYHVLARWDFDNVVSGSNYLDIWLNNSQTTAGSGSPTTSGTPYAPAGQLFIGSDANGTSQAQALIDDFAIFDRVLTTTEITNIYNSGTGREAGYVADSSLKFYAKMDGSGTLSPVTYNGGATADQTAYNASTNTNGNMITDGNMETAGTANWSADNSATLSKVTSGVLFDTQSLKTEIAVGQVWGGASYNYNSVLANTTYTISGWVKSSSTNSSWIQITDNGSGTYTHLERISHSSWTYVEGVVKTSSNITSLQVRCVTENGVAGDYVLCDNISLTPNLVDNGGMEGTYSSGVAPGWTSQTGGAATFAESATAHSGSKSQSITSANSWTSLYQAFTPTNGNYYLAKAWLRSDTAGKTAFLTYYDLTTSTSYDSPDITLTSANTWYSLSFIFKGVNAGIMKVSSEDTNHVWLVDDYSLIPLDNTALSFQSWAPALDSPGDNSTELITGDNSTFTSSVGSWARQLGNGTLVASGGKGVLTNTDGVYGWWGVNAGLVTGKYYTVRAKLKSISGSTTVGFGDGINVNKVVFTITGTEATYTGSFLAAHANFGVYNGYIQQIEMDDISVKEVPNPLSVQGDSDGVTSTTSGARGNGYTFDGSTGYLRQKTYDVNIGTLTYADTNTDISDTGQEFEDWDNDDAGSAEYMVVVTNSDNTTSWGYFCANDGGTQTAVYTLKACTGGAEGFNGTSPSGKTPVGYEVRKTDYQITGAITVGAWVNPSAVSKSIITKGDAASGTTITFRLQLNFAGYAIADVWNGGSSAVATGNTDLRNGWHFVVMSYSPSSSLSLYVDGSLQDSDTSSVPASLNDLNYATLFGAGLSSAAISTPLTGSIDSPFVIGSALTASQIQDIYNSTASHYGLTTNNAVTNTVNANSTAPTNDTSYATYTLTSGSSSAIMAQGATTISTNTTNLPNSAQYLRLQNADATNALTVDWVAVAKQASTAPTVSAPASEEKGGAPVAHWKFDDGTGTNAQDSSPNNNDGTITGASWQTEDMCVSGKCLYFDGVNDHIVNGSGTSLGLWGTDFTMEAWVDPKSLPGSYTNRGVIGADSNGPEFHLYKSGSSLYPRIGKSGVSGAANGTTEVPLNRWSHVAVTFNNTSKLVSYYVNGTGAGSTTYSVTFSGGLSNLIGASSPYDFDNYLFHGQMDDVKIYNYARTAAQVKTDYASRGTSKGTSASLSSPSSLRGGGADAAISSGLVGYWKMDEASWTNDCSTASVLDSSGNGNNGKSCPATTGPTGGAAGKFGNAGGFDGTDEYVDTGTGINTPMAGDFSVFAWIKTTDSDRAIIFGNYNGSTSINFEIQTGASGYLRFYTNNGSTSQELLDTDNAVNNGNWHHVGITRNGSTGKIFVDGVESYSGTVFTGTLASAINWRWGRDSRTGVTAFNGTIDEGRVYNRALSPAEVRALYNWAPGPVGYWNFEEGSGQSANDTSGNANTGTATGTTIVSGKFGKGRSFNGSSDYIDAGTNSTLGITKAVTINAWVKPNSSIDGLARIYTGNGGAFGTDGVTRAWFYIDGTWRYSAVVSASVPINSWSYWSATYDSIAREIKIYVNGILKGTTTLSGLSTYDITLTTNNFVIGTAQTKVERFFPGSIDDVRIYNYARTQKQIVEDMLGGGSVIASGARQSAVGYWKFDEGQGPVARSSVWNSAGSTTNLIYNPSFESNVTTGWEVTGDYTVSRVTSGCVVGSGCARIVAPGTSIGDNAFRAPPAGVAIEANKTYVLSLWARSISGGTTMKTTIYGESGSQSNTLTTDWKKFTDTVTSALIVPGSLEHVYTWLTTAGTYEIDGVQIEEVTTATPYCDGSLTGNGTRSWSGTAHASTSTCTYGQDGEVNGATWTQSGKFGKALSFDGTDDYVNAGASSSFDFGTGAASLSVWIKPTSLPSNLGCIVNKGNSGIGVQRGISLCINSSGQLRLFVTRDAEVSSATTSTVSTGTWAHIVGIDDGVSHKVYLNGQLVQNITAPTGSLTDTAIPMTVGRLGTQVSQYFNGLIDEVKIYNYALTSDEVKTDYNHGTALSLGALGSSTSYQLQANNQIYCVPGDASTCSAPVGEWNFEEGSGQSANDSSGNGNTGTWAGTGTHYAPGKYGKGGKFNGSSDYVNQSYQSSLDGETTTISAWFKTGADDDTHDTLLSKGMTIYTDNAAAGWVITRTRNALAGAENKMRLRIGDGTNTAQIYSTRTFVDNNWHHLSAVIDQGTANTAYLYIDGILEGSTSVSTIGSILNTNYGVLIGKASQAGSSGADYWNGSIDGVKVFNYARTAAQVAWDYNRGGPVGWWKMNECQGVTLFDASGKGNNGTITIGASGTQTAVGDCSTSATTAWYSGRTGKYNSSLNFDGTDDYVSMGNTQDMATNTFAVSAWVKTSTNFSGGNVIIAAKANSGNGQQYSLQFRTTNKTAFVVANGSAANVASSNNTLNDGSWHHIVGVQNGNATSIYVDGVLNSTDSTNTVTTTSNSNNFNVARRYSGDMYYTGQIDDVRIYNYALTGTQVKTLYNENASVRFGPSTGTP